MKLGGSGVGAPNYRVQLVEFSSAGVRAAGVVETEGPIVRGIFAKGRLLGFSDQSLSVIDTSDVTKPKVTYELALARNVLAVRPNDAAVMQLSGGELRALSGDLDTATLSNESPLASFANEGNAYLFGNGKLSYVVTNVH